MSNSIKKEKKTIPTYIPKKAMDLPMFFEKSHIRAPAAGFIPFPFRTASATQKQTWNMTYIPLKTSIS